MGLFDCVRCGHAENTAMAPWYGMEKIQECSLCHTGVWHGMFERFIREKNVSNNETQPKFGHLFEVDMDAVLKERFEAGQGVIQLQTDMPDAAILLAIKQAATFGKPFLVIPPVKS